MYKYIAIVLYVSLASADVINKTGSKGATLKPLSVCCDIPEIGEAKHLATCSNPKMKGPCNDVQCVFEESGFLTNKETLNKDAYKNHLLRWAQDHKGWSVAVNKAIEDCVDTEPRQHLDYPCKAYDVFACTGIAMLKKCPNEAWKC
ncbi:general odorant-binding protein 68-like [Anticarsia gemmatalis]|uniref:general odorant-binding protein 68-like n=1 Tax=Anticarsia gemmatalis TaxID=129554 RepID=UPI003F773C12